MSVFLLLADAYYDRRFPLIRAYLLLVFYGIWELAGIAGAFVVWLFSGVWMGRNPTLFLEWNYTLQRLWVRGFAQIGLRLFNMTVCVEEEGHLPGNAPVLVLVRHTSLADTILATYLMRIRRNFRLRYVMKQELLWDPCLDIVGNRLPNYFVDRASANTQKEIEAISALAEGLDAHEGVILWPEATRFSPEKRERALERLRKTTDDNLLEMAAQMKWVLPPRLGGVMGLLERNPELDVFFCAHTGFEKASSFREFFRGAMMGREIKAKIWGFPAEKVPREQGAQKRWIYENWVKVNDFVAGSHAELSRQHLM